MEEASKRSMNPVRYEIKDQMQINIPIGQIYNPPDSLEDTIGVRIQKLEANEEKWDSAAQIKFSDLQRPEFRMEENDIELEDIYLTPQTTPKNKHRKFAKPKEEKMFFEYFYDMDDVDKKCDLIKQEECSREEKTCKIVTAMPFLAVLEFYIRCLLSRFLYAIGLKKKSMSDKDFSQIKMMIYIKIRTMLSNDYMWCLGNLKDKRTQLFD